jgi:hypothetical protein
MHKRLPKTMAATSGANSLPGEGATFSVIFPADIVTQRISLSLLPKNGAC